MGSLIREQQSESQILRTRTSLRPVLPSDHVSEANSPSSRATIYLDLADSGSAGLFGLLESHKSLVSTFQYLVRYKPPEDRTRRTPLSGYGVEMALKKTDYLVVDDRVTAGSQEGVPETTSASSSDSFADILGEDPWLELSVPISTAELSGRSRDVEGGMTPQGWDCRLRR